MRLRLHSFLPISVANGPGNRAVVWVQGCLLGCPGCFNAETHASNGGHWIAVADLTARIQSLERSIEGVTISGGEPLQQANAVLALLAHVRCNTTLSAVLFTGFRWEEVLRLPQHHDLLACVDVLVVGRYDPRQRLARGLRGSANKSLHFLTRRYSQADFDAVPEAEVVIDTDGTTTVSGIEPATISA